MTNTSDLLESYIEGKDADKYQILESIYSENAIVEFEIASRHISFPEKITGNREIARVLSKDFNKKYQQVRTYYLSKPTNRSGNIYFQKWLVVMRDITTDATRIGTGYYDWEFSVVDMKLKIFKHKIYIHEMLSVDDSQMVELERIQNELTYPWVKEHTAKEVLSVNAALGVITRYLL